MLKHLLAFLLGALLAGAFWHWLGSSEETVGPEVVPGLEPEELVTDPVKLETETTPERKITVPGARVEAELEPEEDEALVSSALLAYARDEIRKAWNKLRREPIPADIEEAVLAQYVEQVLALPGWMGEDAARKAMERDKALEDARTGGAQALLVALDDGAGPVFEIVEDNTRFSELFQRDSQPKFVDGPTLDLNSYTPEDGVTITFPAGVFKTPDLLQRWTSHRERMPRDVTIKGAGKDLTLFVGEFQGARSDVRNLTLTGFTLHADSGYCFDQRYDGMVVNMEDVRLTGFDSGAGSSCALGTGTLVLQATRCEILGGYGRAPAFGNLFDVRTNGLVARFDRCVVDLVDLDYNYRQGTILFRQCELTRILDDPSDWEGPSVRLDRSPIDFHPKEGDWKSGLQRDLNDLFPDWKAQLGH